jgi:hypothetical protein
MDFDFEECPSILSSEEKPGCLFKERKIGWSLMSS